MADPVAYDFDLAFIHDSGFGDFSRNSAPGILALLASAGLAGGTVVELGCGSGILAEALTAAGYRVVGVDISPAMIEIARRRVPAAEFHVQSFLDFRLPPCQAVTALNEVFNYLFDERNSLDSLRQLFTAVHDALLPGGLLVFDVAEPREWQGPLQGFREGDGWLCLVYYEYLAERQQLTRRIVSFRQVGDTYRRREEIHRQQLHEGATLAGILRDVGFQVQLVREYGTQPLPDHRVGLVARKAPAAPGEQPPASGRAAAVAESNQPSGVLE